MREEEWVKVGEENIQRRKYTSLQHMEIKTSKNGLRAYLFSCPMVVESNYDSLYISDLFKTDFQVIITKISLDHILANKEICTVQSLYSAKRSVFFQWQ